MQFYGVHCLRYAPTPRDGAPLPSNTTPVVQRQSRLCATRQWCMHAYRAPPAVCTGSIACCTPTPAVVQGAQGAPRLAAHLLRVDVGLGEQVLYHLVQDHLALVQRRAQRRLQVAILCTGGRERLSGATGQNDRAARSDFVRSPSCSTGGGAAEMSEGRRRANSQGWEGPSLDVVRASSTTAALIHQCTTEAERAGTACPGQAMHGAPSWRQCRPTGQSRPPGRSAP